MAAATIPNVIRKYGRTSGALDHDLQQTPTPSSFQSGAPLGSPPVPETLKAKPTGLEKAGFYDSEGRRIG